ncbi:tetratricopeptide repeat protein [Hyalangium gracile]|uniref:tetratricopeptide repeat protein n=1 Tax=Hyalangium gracile TaxID=394092 RepID=UPI001CC93193|nr:hypothetical protein [Hyalangium gracile]
MKIYHFKKRAPRKDEGWSRDPVRRTLEIERPTLPEMAIEEPPEELEEEPVRARPARKPEPASKAKSRASSAAPEADGRASRKGRGGQASRKAPAADDEPPQGSVAERLNTSRQLIYEGRLDEACVILERLVKLGVASGPVHTELGAIYMAQGYIERALERFEEALHLEPMDLFARVCRGEARLERGDLRLAREDLQRVLDVGTAGSPLVERAQLLLQRANEERKRH